MPLADSAKCKTAFPVPGRGLFQYKVMPFGLKNATQSMCKLIDKVIPYEMQTNVYPYVDDMLLISENFKAHINLIREVAL